MYKLNFFFITSFVLITTLLSGQITGTVYRDYNENGVRNTSATYNEVGIAGVTVNCIDALGNSGTTLTLATGNYTLSGCT